ncbi:hypothetical protein WOLCODRAFT_99513 [Wolfiporia cocos MD-104 SS10]|uniref:Uncharacterized protein n=1 Tax=Wolfiporia cocos (strain MD-104) TaxID=742152 RepID=A0A2H3JQ13_WOLCO|nr:hypothetical protein WOLCODRAFT_99513 [Wolfiporia cocos MD-104 SS10]
MADTIDGLFEDYPGVDRRSCRLLGPTALITQGLMGVLVISSLIYKRHRETPKRPWRIWLFDVSKQVIGQLVVHGVNVLISHVVAHAAEGNACVLYFLNILVDTTIGVGVIYFFLHILTWLLSEKCQLKGFESGQYGSPPSFSSWARQAAVYVVSLLSMKLLAVALFAVWPGTFKMGEWLLSFLGESDAVQVIFTMGLFPIMMNILPVSYTQRQEAEIVKNWPKNKRRCYNFCVLLYYWHPTPSWEEWVYFGFCTCTSAESEIKLRALYRELLDRCTFEEFCAAFEASSIIALFDRHGFTSQRKNFHNLEDILSGSPHMYKSVWKLKQFVMNKDMWLSPSVYVDYGFMNCRTSDEFAELKALYKLLFELECKTSFDPVELHNAAIKGKILQYASRLLKFKKGQKKLYARLMRNPYPLPEY